MGRTVWQIELEDRLHTVELEHSKISGKRVISVDGNVVEQGSKPFDTGSKHVIKIGNHSGLIIVHYNWPGFSYSLSVDGREIPPGKTILSEQKNHSQPAMRTGHQIFLSYRRDDSADIAGRIYDRLVNSFGSTSVFKDVDSIPFGVDFREHLNKMVAKCDILLAIIGVHWLSAKDPQGNPRMDDPRDFVRFEIEIALKRKFLLSQYLSRGRSCRQRKIYRPV